MEGGGGGIAYFMLYYCFYFELHIYGGTKIF